MKYKVYMKQKHIIMYDTVLKLVKTTNKYVQDWVSIVIYYYIYIYIYISRYGETSK